MAVAILLHPAEKHCNKCNITKHFSNFSINKRNKIDGLQCWCKPCRKQYRLDNLDSYKKKDREDYLKKIEYYKDLAAKQRARLGKDLIKQYNQNYWTKNKTEQSIRNKIWREKNQELLKAYSRNYYENNKEIYYLNNKRKWEETPHLVLEACRKRIAIKLKAIPKWSDNSLIIEFYKKAKQLTNSTGTMHQVDHIVPLQNKLVCGLHVQDNLQIITLSENASKGNRWWPDMP